MAAVLAAAVLAQKRRKPGSRFATDFSLDDAPLYAVR
jgi:hypothetical protein